jgi:pimeloyl-ACP methyl ester carboxylesterase
MHITKYIIFGSLLLSFQVGASECVILLHGLLRSDSSFSELETKLTDAGYAVVNHDYPSTEHSIEKLAKDEISRAIARCPERVQIHFVTHSLGGILVRQYLSKYSIENLGRVVMLGPPNKGSEVVDTLKDVPGFELMHGPAGMELGTGELSVPNTLGPANFDLGIIAGTSSVNLILSTMLPSVDDGKVTVESTKLEGMSDHITMPVTHSFMMSNDKVIDQVIHFLRQGAFMREN